MDNLNGIQLSLIMLSACMGLAAQIDDWLWEKQIGYQINVVVDQLIAGTMVTC